MIRRLGTYTEAIVLSGDVHFSSSLALDFWNGADPTVDSRIVQLTSSGSRNSPRGELRAVIRAARFSQQLLRGLPFERLALEAASRRSSFRPAASHLAGPAQPHAPQSPSLLPATGWPAGTTVPGRQAAGLAVAAHRAARRRRHAHRPCGPEAPPPPLPTSTRADGDRQLQRDRRQARRAGVEPHRAAAPARVPHEHRRRPLRDRRAPSSSVVHELWSTDGPNSDRGCADAPAIGRRSPLVPTLAAPQLEVVADA